MRRTPGRRCLKRRARRPPNPFLTGCSPVCLHTRHVCTAHACPHRPSWTTATVACHSHACLSRSHAESPPQAGTLSSRAREGMCHHTTCPEWRTSRAQLWTRRPRALASRGREGGGSSPRHSGETASRPLLGDWPGGHGVPHAPGIRGASRGTPHDLTLKPRVEMGLPRAPGAGVGRWVRPASPCRGRPPGAGPGDLPRGTLHLRGLVQPWKPAAGPPVLGSPAGTGLGPPPPEHSQQRLKQQTWARAALPPPACTVPRGLRGDAPWDLCKSRLKAKFMLCLEEAS